MYASNYLFAAIRFRRLVKEVCCGLQQLAVVSCLVVVRCQRRRRFVRSVMGLIGCCDTVWFLAFAVPLRRETVCLVPSSLCCSSVTNWGGSDSPVRLMSGVDVIVLVMGSWLVVGIVNVAAWKLLVCCWLVRWLFVVWSGVSLVRTGCLVWVLLGWCL